MTQSIMYERHRFLPEKIQYAVPLCHRFKLGHRGVEDLMAERGMRNLRSVELVQRFLNVHTAVYNLFNIGRHLVSVDNYYFFRQRAFVFSQNAAAM